MRGFLLMEMLVGLAVWLLIVGSVVAAMGQMGHLYHELNAFSTWVTNAQNAMESEMAGVSPPIGALLTVQSFGSLKKLTIERHGKAQARIELWIYEP